MGKNQYDELTDQQRLFADYYFELNNGTKAAIKAGYGESGAHVAASRLLKNDKVRGYIDSLHKERRERIMNQLAVYAEDAVKDLHTLAKSADSEAVRLQAVKDIMDRSGYKATDKIEQRTELDGKILFGFSDPSEDSGL